jgi:hypothetical protein
MNKEKFDELYYNCFDKEDNITFCGRDNCRKLLNYIIKNTGNQTKYGDMKTGKLNIEEVVNLHKSIQ